MRPRFQQGQIMKRGPNWVLRYHEDRTVDGQIRRVRTMSALGAYSQHPYKGSQTTQLRSLFNDKIGAILAGINSPAKVAESGVTLGDFIERSYFPRLEQRLQRPGDDELHIEPSTVKGYKDIWKVHVQNKPIAKIRLRDFTAGNGQRFLESLPQNLSHQTHLRIKNFLRGVFTWAITSEALAGSNPMEATKAGGRTKKADPKDLDLRQNPSV